jgi:hypothetical protein
VIWDVAGDPIPASRREDLRRLADGVRAGTLRDELAPLLGEDELAALAERSEATAGLDRFPDPDPDRRPFPWPPI